MGPDDRIRYDLDGELDEIVAHGATVHLERMHASHWWMQVRMQDGTTVTVNLASRRDVRPYVEVEEGGG
jgi:hypothetical protein